MKAASWIWLAAAIVVAVPARAGEPDAGAPWADVSGYAALEWYRFEDSGPTGLDFTQPTLRLHLKARELWGRPLTFQLKGRARHDDRTRRHGLAPADEWSNRVYVFSLSYGAPDAPLTWQAGRIASNAIAAAGPVDGLLVEARVGGDWRAGGFAGALPDWRDTAPRGSLQKYGLFLRGERRDNLGRRWAAALAATAEYHGGTPSRQYVYLSGDWRPGAAWNLYQNVELDLNTGWRRDAAPGAIALSNLFAGTNWRPRRGAALGLSYDNRRAYRTWDNRSLPDSLFDDALRQGLRANASARLGGVLSVFGDGGWRRRHGESDPTWSWGAGAVCDRLLADGVSLTAQAFGFDGPWARGWNPSLQLRRITGVGHVFGLAGGAYLYEPRAGDRRQNDWARAEATLRLARRYWLTGQYEHDWGDDVEGSRFLAELGVDF